MDSSLDPSLSENSSQPVSRRASKKSMEWYEKAAKNGSTQAYYALGVMYASPDIVGVDYSLKKAVRYFQLVNFYFTFVII